MRGSRETKAGKVNNVYKIFPHAICKSRQIERALSELIDKNIKIADSTRNTKINQIKTIKTCIPIRERGNVILSSKCTCKKKMRLATTKMNETAGMLAGRYTTTLKAAWETAMDSRRWNLMRASIIGGKRIIC